MTDARAFAKSVYQAIDTMDEKELVPFLTENCTFVFGKRAAGCRPHRRRQRLQSIHGDNCRHQARSRRRLGCR